MKDKPIETGNPSDLSGLLVVNPEDAGNERTQPETTEQNPGAKADGQEADVDWDAPEGADNAADDAATGDDGQQTGDDGDAEAEGSEEQPSGEPFYEVSVNGTAQRITLKEALAGYQRQADYTLKTQEVATAREQLAGELQQLQAHRASYKQVLDALEAKLGPANQEPTGEQWDALRASDPDKYATEWADYQRRAEQRNAIKAERERVANEETGEARKALQTYVDGERVKLVAAFPQWKAADGKVDANKMTAAIKEVREYVGKTFGYTEAELDRSYDHRMIVLAHKAMLYDRAEAARKTAKGKLAAAPEMPAPGARVPPKSGKAVAQQEAQKKFDKSGRIDDAVNLLLA